MPLRALPSLLASIQLVTLADTVAAAPAVDCAHIAALRERLLETGLSI